MTSCTHDIPVSIPPRLEKQLQNRGLRVILGGKATKTSRGRHPEMADTAIEFESGRDGIRALNTLEAQLQGEHWFLEQVRGTVRETLGFDDPEAPLPEADFKTLVSKNGHDNLIHVAQFYFFLDALNCTTPERIEAFIEAHNSKVSTDLAHDDAIMRAASLKKTQFSVNDITQVRMTLLYYGAPVFAVTELGYFLSDLMSPATTTNLVKDLVKGGVFEQLAGPPLEGGAENYREKDAGPITTDPRRKLIRPKAKFLSDYQTSLLMARRKILATG